MPRRTLRRAVADFFGPIEHFDGLPQACLGPSNTSTGCRRLVWAHRTLRRAAAGLFGPVEHFDGLPQACLGPSNTSTGCRRLVWAHRTLRRAAAGLLGLIEHFDGLSQVCMGLSNTSTERATSYRFLRLTFAPVHSVPPSEGSPPPRAGKGNPVKNRSSTRYCKSTFHRVSLSTQPLSEPFGREGAPRYTQDKPGNLPNERIDKSSRD